MRQLLTQGAGTLGSQCYFSEIFLSSSSSYQSLNSPSSESLQPFPQSQLHSLAFCRFCSCSPQLLTRSLLCTAGHLPHTSPVLHLFSVSVPGRKTLLPPAKCCWVWEPETPGVTCSSCSQLSSLCSWAVRLLGAYAAACRDSTGGASFPRLLLGRERIGFLSWE